KVEIGIYCKTHTWENVALVDHLFPAQAHGFGERQPGLDATHISLMTIVVQNALQPQAAHRGIRAVRHDGGILLWNPHLVVVSIGDPPTDLFRRALAAVHGSMIRVVNMVVGAF